MLLPVAVKIRSCALTLIRGCKIKAINSPVKWHIILGGLFCLSNYVIVVYCYERFCTKISVRAEDFGPAWILCFPVFLHQVPSILCGCKLRRIYLPLIGHCVLKYFYTDAICKWLYEINWRLLYIYHNLWQYFTNISS